MDPKTGALLERGAPWRPLPRFELDALRARAREVRAAVAMACVALAACASTSAGSGDAGGDASCIPAPGSCDAPTLAMSPLDAARGCLAPRTALPDVCVTSVNRCTPSAGLSAMCAFAPDGRVFATVTSDNFMLTARGWRFVLPLSSYPNQSAIPPDELATPEQALACDRALCAPPCPGADAIHWFCPDAGMGDAARD